MATEERSSPRGSEPARRKPAAKKAAGGSTAERTSASSDAQRRPTAGRVAERAMGQLLDLTGREPEGVTGLERTEDGWTVLVDVVELRRVPSTTDILATYEVAVDARGQLEGYRRARRFVRGSAEE